MLGVLTNGLFSSSLAALNWSRIGEKQRAQSAWVLAGGCLVVTVLTIVIPKFPAPLVMVASITATRQSVANWKPIFDNHTRLGGRRASILLALAVIVGLLVALVFAIGFGSVLLDPDGKG